MRIKVDKTKLAEDKRYDHRNFVQCRCGKHYYPSKKMFVEFLKQFGDVDAEVDIWSVNDWSTGKVTIHVELMYKEGELKRKVGR